MGKGHLSKAAVAGRVAAQWFAGGRGWVDGLCITFCFFIPLHLVNYLLSQSTHFPSFCPSDSLLYPPVGQMSEKLSGGSAAGWGQPTRLGPRYAQLRLKWSEVKYQFWWVISFFYALFWVSAVSVRTSLSCSFHFANEFLSYGNWGKTITLLQAVVVIKFILRAILIGLFGY